MTARLLRRLNEMVGSHRERGANRKCFTIRDAGAFPSGLTDMRHNPSVNRIARKLRLPVSSALRAPAAGYLKR
jgi:hypothetical protein